MDHSKHIPMSDVEVVAANIDGANVYGPDDEKIGTVSHTHGTPPGGKVVVDVGGFLGIGAKPVALPMTSLNFMRDPDGAAHATTALTKDELKAMPEHRD
ncbi:PRC-barrel domain-containing protein [Wenxinia saemankumensis]|uniref:PRC-barrel domain-containing protein n=1 Tax=Wenxinia saemankumensis TaxID=1447782 RepID=A0A1M6G7Z7_9RHOB|nr:PRC-barrel domain-containing protein [Wenxinia saemankumensis]SHJ06056.1 PRC-barrel domain-containing protein [Wenxinia saemankumensis]